RRRTAHLVGVAGALPAPARRVHERRRRLHLRAVRGGHDLPQPLGARERRRRVLRLQRLPQTAARRGVHRGDRPGAAAGAGDGRQGRRAAADRPPRPRDRAGHRGLLLRRERAVLPGAARGVSVRARPDGAVGRGDRPAHGVQPVSLRPVDGRGPGREGAHRLPRRRVARRARLPGRVHLLAGPDGRAGGVRPDQSHPGGRRGRRRRAGVPGAYFGGRTVRVAYVINQFPPNITAGLGRYVEEITPHLAGGLRLAVFTLNDGHLPVHERRDGVTVHRPLGRVLGAISRRRRLNRTRRTEFLLLALNVVVSNWRYFLRLRRLPREERPDLVAVHDSTNFLAALLCHYVLRLPVVFHGHTTEYGVAPQRSFTDPAGVCAAVERWLGRIARRVVVATPEVRDQLAAAGWDRDTIDLVCLGGTFERRLAGVDRAALRSGAAALRARLGIADGDPVLLFVGRIERQKGVYELLEAMEKIAVAVPRLRLVIVGEGDEAGVARIVAEAGLDGRVLTSGGFVDGPALLEYYE